MGLGFVIIGLSFLDMSPAAYCKKMTIPQPSYHRVDQYFTFLHGNMDPRIKQWVAQMIVTGMWYVRYSHTC